MLEEAPSKGDLDFRAVLAASATAVFLLACVFGEGLGGSWGSNTACSPIFGCTSGFFGFDAVEHFLFGVAAAWILVWIFKARPRFSLLHGTRWKNVLTVVAIVALVSVGWEHLEMLHDLFRTDILHQSLVNFRLHINLLDQPTNLDTLGDLFFAIVGSFIASLFPRSRA